MLSALVISLGLAPTVAMAMPVDPLVGHFGMSQRVCTDAGPGTASCTAEVRTDPAAMSATPARGGIKPNAVGNGGAYDPSYLQSAYNVASLAKSAGGGQTVAIVDAYDDPNVAKDLSYYRAYFGLSACTTSSGCFRKVNQTGGSRYPSRNVGWAEEISLDVEMVSAICPNCKILLVEASSSSFSNLLTAVDTAVKSGAKYVSMSWGAAEFSGETGYDGHFNNAAIAFTVAAGDSGYGVDYPAASPYVTAVGGTSLNQATNTGTRNATETAWSGTGSGCSAYEAKPAWQTDGGCSGRTVNDVSAVADPNTGVWAYDTYGQHGWLIFGGTSVATPIIASVYALAGNGATAQHTYANTQSLNDVTSGSDGSCGTAYLCTAAPSYDGPTGNGTPNGDGAF